MVTDEPAADPVRTLDRLWRHELTPPAPRRGPRPRLDLDRVVDAAVARADRDGLAGLTVRTLAADLGLSRMALYGYTSGREELVELMAERVHESLLTRLRADLTGEVFDDPARQPAEVAAPEPQPEWRTRLRLVAEAELDLHERHRWLLDLTLDRPGLGPTGTEVYELELAVLDGLGLDDLQMDRVRWLVINFVRGIARTRVVDEAETVLWWRQRADRLAELITESRFPLAVRVGAAAGAAQQSAYDPEAAWTFGLERLLDGCAVLINNVGPNC